MAKNNKNNEYSLKSIMEMSDTEFVTNADYLASPYYRAYVNAKLRTQTYSDKPNKKTTAAPVKGQRSKKRGLFLLLIAIFCLVIIAMTVLQFVTVEAIAPYAGIYKVPKTAESAEIDIMLADPIIGLVKKFVSSFNMDSKFYTQFIETMPEDAKMTAVIGSYAVPVAAAILVICAVIGFIKSLVALFKGRKNGYYKKFRFGLMGIIMTICGIVLCAGGLLVAGFGVESLGSFFGGTADALAAAYGLYATIALPVLIIICSALSYKK